jgi:hypothetical protein
VNTIRTDSVLPSRWLIIPRPLAVLLILLLGFGGWDCLVRAAPADDGPRTTGKANRPAWLELRQLSQPTQRPASLSSVVNPQRLQQLEVEAEQALQQGNADQAFQLWFETLRLRQQQPPAVEINALGQVGERAWSRNRSLEVQAIKARLDQLEGQLRRSGTLQQSESLSALALAYRRIRDLTQAEARYQEQLTQIPQPPPSVERQRLLNILGQIKLEQLDYAAAVPVYQNLLQLLAPAANPSAAGQAGKSAAPTALAPARQTAPAALPTLPSLPGTLSQLAFAQEKAEQFSGAVQTLQQLRVLLPAERQPSLDLAIARNQQQAGDLVSAVQTYQDTYRQAQRQGQLGLARDSLIALSNLYGQRQQWDDALLIDQLLLALSRQTYDFYGQVDAYLKLTRLYLQQEQLPAAAASLRSAQNLATQLGYTSPQLSELERTLEQATLMPKQ